jgi:N6-L-threonylcarbamoyladenine synthase
VLGQTVDDAAGEAFDKVAKLLKLPYPGGPEVSRLAEKAKSPVNFPRPMINSKDYNFSFAGLKTAVLYHVRALNAKHLTLSTKADICAGFQQAAVDVLTAKTLRAVQEFRAKSVSLSGGVSANKNLRRSLQNLCQSHNLQFFAPSFSLSTDNAEMIGLAAGFKLFFGQKPLSYQKVRPNPALSL